MGANYKDKELAFFDSLPDPHIIFFARRQICAVEEYTVSLPAKRKLDRFDKVSVLGRITQEHSHRPMKACTGFSYNTDLCTDFRLWRRNGSGKTLLETDAAGEKIEYGHRHDSIPGEWNQSPFVHKLDECFHCYHGEQICANTEAKAVLTSNLPKLANTAPMLPSRVSDFTSIPTIDLEGFA